MTRLWRFEYFQIDPLLNIKLEIPLSVSPSLQAPSLRQDLNKDGNGAGSKISTFN